MTHTRPLRVGSKRVPLALKYLFHRKSKNMRNIKPHMKVFIRNGVDIYETTNNIATWRQEYLRLGGELR